MAEAGKPNWTAIAQMMSDLGLRDAKGGKPNRHTAMMTWRRVLAERPVKSKLSVSDKLANLDNPPKPHQNEPAPTGDAQARRERLREMTNKRSIR
jgi:hypothetical protein